MADPPNEADGERAEHLVRSHIATLQREADEMREALTWVGEVYPATNPESGGAIVHMTWEQFNAMRAQVGLKPVKGLSIRAALKTLPPQAGPWRSEPAPTKSGTHIIVNDERFGVGEAMLFDNGAWGLASFNGQIIEAKFSQWMPMPALPPQEQAK
jgi:hypothetical protein